MKGIGKVKVLASAFAIVIGMAGPYSAIASDNLSVESAKRWYAEGEQAVVNVKRMFNKR